MRTREANVVFAPTHDRKGRVILSVRDENTFDHSLRQKRLMTLVHLYLLNRYKVSTVHYVAPTDDNAAQCERMKAWGIYSGRQPRGRADHRDPGRHGGRRRAHRK